MAGKTESLEVSSEGLRVPLPRAVPIPRFAMQRMHALGRCTPCRFFSFRADGCHKGNACEFCHLCNEQDALKRTKRAHVARRKEEAREKKLEVEAELRDTKGRAPAQSAQSAQSALAHSSTSFWI